MSNAISSVPRMKVVHVSVIEHGYRNGHFVPFLKPFWMTGRNRHNMEPNSIRVRLYVLIYALNDLNSYNILISPSTFICPAPQFFFLILWVFFNQFSSCHIQKNITFYNTFKNMTKYIKHHDQFKIYPQDLQTGNAPRIKSIWNCTDLMTNQY